jgi:hypothetical protein
MAVAGRSALRITPSSRQIIMINVLFDMPTPSEKVTGAIDNVDINACVSGFDSLKSTNRLLVDRVISDVLEKKVSL